MPAPSTTVRTGRFRFSEPALLFPRARLYPDRLALDGWRWRGRYRLDIPLSDVLQVDVTRTGRLVLWLRSGEAVRLYLDDADGWKRAIEGRHSPAQPDA